MKHAHKALFAVLCMAQSVLAQPPSQDFTAQTKAFEAALALAQTLTQWGYLTIAGSLLTLVGTSYYRPPARWFRFFYFLFVPGWAYVARSLYDGTRVQRDYLTFLFNVQKSAETVSRVNNSIREDAYNQIHHLQIGLVIFGIWVFFYLLWWILASEVKQPKEDK